MAANHRQAQVPESTPQFDHARLQLAKLHAGAGKTLREVWLQLADLVAATLEVERVGAWILVDEGSALRCRYLFQRSSREVFEGAMLRAQDFPEYFGAIQSRRTVAADDAPRSALTMELSQPYLEPLGIVSMLDSPIYIEGRVVGVVCHEHVGTARAWSAAENDFASAVADNIARLYQEHEHQQARSALRSYEQRLMELHRMEAVGRIAAEVAHDFRGILGAALGFAELIRRSPSLSPDVDRYAQRIIEAMQRGGQLTQEVMNFGKDVPVTPCVIDAQAAIESLSGMFRVLLGDRIRLQLDCQRPSRIFMDTSQLERALLNLVLNARDAMPGGGTLTIAAEDTVAEDVEGQNATFVCLSVTDTGVGMDADTCKLVLKPFFTTKGDAGTGLGLAIVDQIVTRTGGFIRIDSELGKGTSAKLYLPRIAGPLSEQST